MLPQFRTKRVAVEAFQLGVDEFLPNWFLESLAAGEVITHGVSLGKLTYVDLITPEGPIAARRGDFIIRSEKGHIYPCSPRLFCEIFDEGEYE